jgi:ankyrin repeat protein
MDHVSRAAMLGSAGYNLICKANIEGTESLNNNQKKQELKLIQIALLLHDSGREGDGEDLWDTDSSVNIFQYLTSRLNVDPTLAKKVVEAVRNKDWKPGEKYYQFNMEAEQFDESIRNEPLPQEMQRLRLAIHYGDCIDVQRVRKMFKQKHLLLIQQNYPENDKIKAVSKKLIREGMRLITTMRNTDPAQCKGENAFNFVQECIEKQNPYLKILTQEDQSYSFTDLKISTKQMNQAWMQNQYLFKSIKTGPESYWGTDFIPSLIDHKKLELRVGKRKKYTYRLGKPNSEGVREYEVVPTDKNDHNHIPLWTNAQKKETTPAQSMSFADPAMDFKPSVYSQKQTNLVGIAIPIEGALIQRISAKNLNSRKRSYDLNKKEDLEDYLEDSMFYPSLNELRDNQKEIENPQTEIMARIKWVENNDNYRIVIYSDNFESRLIAQLWAWDLYYALCDRAGNVQFPKIMFFDSQDEYTDEEQNEDLHEEQNNSTTKILQHIIGVVKNNQVIEPETLVNFLNENNSLSAHILYRLVKPNLEILLKSPSLRSKTMGFERAMRSIPSLEIYQIIERDNVTLSQEVIALMLPDLFRLGEILGVMTKEQRSKFMAMPKVREQLGNLFNQSQNVLQLLNDIPDDQHEIILKEIFEGIPIDINQQDAQGFAPLHYAAKEGDPRILKYILSINNLKVSIPDKDQRTALSYAIFESNNVEMTNLLLEAKNDTQDSYYYFNELLSNYKAADKSSDFDKICELFLLVLNNDTALMSSYREKRFDDFIKLIHARFPKSLKIFSNITLLRRIMDVSIPQQAASDNERQWWDAMERFKETRNIKLFSEELKKTPVSEWNKYCLNNFDIILFLTDNGPYKIIYLLEELRLNGLSPVAFLSTSTIAGHFQSIFEVKNLNYRALNQRAENLGLSLEEYTQIPSVYKQLGNNFVVNPSLFQTNISQYLTSSNTLALINLFLSDPAFISLLCSNLNMLKTVFKSLSEEQCRLIFNNKNFRGEFDKKIGDYLNEMGFESGSPLSYKKIYEAYRVLPHHLQESLFSNGYFKKILLDLYPNYIEQLEIRELASLRPSERLHLIKSMFFVFDPEECKEFLNKPGRVKEMFQEQIVCNPKLLREVLLIFNLIGCVSNILPVLVTIYLAARNNQKPTMESSTSASLELHKMDPLELQDEKFYATLKACQYFNDAELQSVEKEMSKFKGQAPASGVQELQLTTNSTEFKFNQ